MTMEFPEFKRCCFCLPLRPGLLIWGYYKIVENALLMLILPHFLMNSVGFDPVETNQKTLVIWIMLFFIFTLSILALIVTDFIAAIVFVVGAHKKHVNKIKGYYIYRIVVFIVTIILIVTGVGISIKWDHNEHMTLHLVLYAVFLLIPAVQVYFLLLLRSEVIKLNGNGDFRYVNNSDEAQYKTTSKEKEVAVENV